MKSSFRFPFLYFLLVTWDGWNLRDVLSVLYWVSSECDTSKTWFLIPHCFRADCSLSSSLCLPTHVSWSCVGPFRAHAGSFHWLILIFGGTWKSVWNVVCTSQKELPLSSWLFNHEPSNTTQFVSSLTDPLIHLYIYWFVFLLFKKIKYSWFTIFCQFLLYSQVTQ